MKPPHSKHTPRSDPRNSHHVSRVTVTPKALLPNTRSDTGSWGLLGCDFSHSGSSKQSPSGEDSLDLEQVEGFVLCCRDLAGPVAVGVHGKAIIPEPKLLGHLQHGEEGQGVRWEPPERGSEPQLAPETFSSRNSAQFTPIPELGITRDGNTRKNEQWIKQDLKQLHQNGPCLTQHKGRVSAAARQALHGSRGKLLHYPSSIAPAAQHTPPSHSHPPATRIPQSTPPPLWIFCPQLHFHLPAASLNLFLLFCLVFPPFLLSPMEFTPTTATPQSPGRFSQLRLNLVYLESLQHLFPAKIIGTFSSLRTSSV